MLKVSEEAGTRSPTEGRFRQPDRSGGAAASTLVLLALVALALNLRSPLIAVPTVIGQIREDLGIDVAVAGLLTSIPVLCFGVLSPLASLLIGRTGIRAAIFASLTGAGVGLVLRPYTGLDGMLGGTLLIGASLAIGNIVSLMVIARDFPKRMAMVTGIYTAALNVGTMLTGALTAPLAAVTGWQVALASWVWMAVLAILLWIWVGYRRRKQPKPDSLSVSGVAQPGLGLALWRRPIVWLLSLALTIHLFVYYAITAWLPAYLVEVDGMSPTRAGFVASAFQVLALVGSFAVPLLARYVPLGPQLIGMGLLWMATPLGMLLIPHQWPLWSFTGGMAQGGAFVVVFMLILQNAADLNDNRRLSSVVQGVGYTLASLGPMVVGVLHEAFGRWNEAYLLLAALSAVLAASGFAVIRVRKPES